MITRFCASDFTVFSNLEVKFSPKINIFIGENGTGKTHLMKAVYAACCLINKKIETPFDKKINSVFTPNSIGRLVRRSVGRGSGSISVYRQDEGEANERSISLALTTLNKATVKQKAWQIDKDVEAVFVPVKDMLANAPGFRSLFSQKKLSYARCDRQSLSPLAQRQACSRKEKTFGYTQQSNVGQGHCKGRNILHKEQKRRIGISFACRRV